MYIETIVPYDKSIEGIALKGVIVVLCQIIYIRSLRTRVPVFARMFLGFDRPEDRPNTLLWLSTQTAVGYLVLVPAFILLDSIGARNLILIPILIVGIGDGFAEPVGINFGRLKYKTHALFSKIKYERSVEGSLCVFIVSLITLVIFKPYFSPTEYIFALITVPIVMTLTEAFSPHTWDNPTLFFAGYLNLYLIKSISFI
jgi:phytol kinase